MKRTRVLEFEFRTGRVTIDYDKCIAPTCGFACVKADRFYGRNVLKILDQKPVLAVTPEEAKRLCNECLGCEIHCQLHATGAIHIELPLAGLKEYKMKSARSRGVE
jgi:hypothetical protein